MVLMSHSHGKKNVRKIQELCSMLLNLESIIERIAM